jgi:type IV pilus assembly protein PilX
MFVRHSHRSRHSCDRSKQRGSTLIFVIIALAVLLVSAAAVLRSSNVATAVATNVEFRTAATQAAEVAINTAITTMAPPAVVNPDTGAGFPAGSYFSTMQPTDPATGLPQINWSTAQVPATQLTTASGTNYQLQWVVDRLCTVSPVTDSNSQCQTAQGAQQGNCQTAGCVQFPTPPRVFYRITVLVSGPKSSRSFVQALVEL